MMKTKKSFTALPAAAMLAFGLAACEDGPAGLGHEAELVTEIVLTEGAPTPTKGFQPIVVNSTLENATVTLGGSETTPLSLNGDGCTEFEPVEVTVTYTVDGRQLSPASFDVNTHWSYNGTTFVGSQPETVAVPLHSTGTARTFTVDVTVVNAAEAGSGITSFDIVPSNLVTNPSDPPGQQLSIDASATATVHVAFNTCTAPNTPPTLVLPRPITREAENASGTNVSFVVTATDAEDGNLTDQVECSHDSGDEFPIGATEVTCSVEDSGELSAEGSFWVYVHDTMAPEFTFIPSTEQTLTADGSHGVTLGDPVDMFGITAADWGPEGEDNGEISPPVSIACTIDGTPAAGQTIGIGETKTVSCTATDDARYKAPTYLGTTLKNSRTQTFDVHVTLAVGDFCGFGTFQDTGKPAFDRPLRTGTTLSAHQRNSTVPFKVCAPNYADGQPATDLAGALRFVLKRDGSTEGFDSEDEEDFPAAGSTTWRYVEKDNHYIFNVKTDRSWGIGLWTGEVSVGPIMLGYGQVVIR